MKNSIQSTAYWSQRLKLFQNLTLSTQLHLSPINVEDRVSSTCRTNQHLVFFSETHALCPTQTNVGHLVKGTNKVLKKWERNPLPISCRKLAFGIICSTHFSKIDLLTWKEDCSMRGCDNCPDMVVNTNDKILKHELMTASSVLWIALGHTLPTPNPRPPKKLTPIFFLFFLVFYPS